MPSTKRGFYIYCGAIFLVGTLGTPTLAVLGWFL